MPMITIEFQRVDILLSQARFAEQIGTRPIRLRGQVTHGSTTRTAGDVSYPQCPWPHGAWILSEPEQTAPWRSSLNVETGQRFDVRFQIYVDHQPWGNGIVQTYNVTRSLSGRREFTMSDRSGGYSLTFVLDVSQGTAGAGDAAGGGTSTSAGAGPQQADGRREHSGSPAQTRLETGVMRVWLIENGTPFGRYYDLETRRYERPIPAADADLIRETIAARLREWIRQAAALTGAASRRAIGDPATIEIAWRRPRQVGAHDIVIYFSRADSTLNSRYSPPGEPGEDQDEGGATFPVSGRGTLCEVYVKVAWHGATALLRPQAMGEWLATVAFHGAMHNKSPETREDNVHGQAAPGDIAEARLPEYRARPPTANDLRRLSRWLGRAVPQFLEAQGGS